MKFLFFILLSTCAFAKVKPPFENPDPQVEKIENACFPSVIILKDVLDKHDIWSRVVQVWFKKPSEGNIIKAHVFIEYIYPKGSTNLWLYDNTGTWDVNFDLKDNPNALSKKVFEDDGDDFVLVKSNFFLE